MSLGICRQGLGVSGLIVSDLVSSSQVSPYCHPIQLWGERELKESIFLNKLENNLTDVALGSFALGLPSILR